MTGTAIVGRSMIYLLARYIWLFDGADASNASQFDAQVRTQAIWHFETISSSNLSGMQIRTEQVDGLDLQGASFSSVSDPHRSLSLQPRDEGDAGTTPGRCIASRAGHCEG